MHAELAGFGAAGIKNVLSSTESFCGGVFANLLSSNADTVASWQLRAGTAVIGRR